MEDSLFVSQLILADRATVNYRLSCNYFKQTYIISVPGGSRVSGSGFWSFSFGERDCPPVLLMDYTSSCCKTTRVDVKFCDSPTLTLIRKSIFSSVIVLDENDAHKLKITRPLFQLPGAKHLIFDENDIQIGDITKVDLVEYDLSFPSNLDVKYKAALLAACVLKNR